MQRVTEHLVLVYWQHVLTSLEVLSNSQRCQKHQFKGILCPPGRRCNRLLMTGHGTRSCSSLEREASDASKGFPYNDSSFGSAAIHLTILV